MKATGITLSFLGLFLLVGYFALISYTITNEKFELLIKIFPDNFTNFAYLATSLSVFSAGIAIQGLARRKIIKIKLIKGE